MKNAILNLSFCLFIIVVFSGCSSITDIQLDEATDDSLIILDESFHQGVSTVNKYLGGYIMELDFESKTADVISLP